MDDFDIVDPVDAEFALLYAEFVKAGGLDSTQSINQAIELVYRELTGVKPGDKCPHGKTPMTCEKCYFHS
jgi:hypothetical protein